MLSGRLCLPETKTKRGCRGAKLPCIPQESLRRTLPKWESMKRSSFPSKAIHRLSSSFMYLFSEKNTFINYRRRHREIRSLQAFDTNQAPRSVVTREPQQVETSEPL